MEVRALVNRAGERLGVSWIELFSEQNRNLTVRSPHNKVKYPILHLLTDIKITKKGKV